MVALPDVRERERVQCCPAPNTAAPDTPNPKAREYVTSRGRRDAADVIKRLEGRRLS